VIEFFYYGCPVCYETEPFLSRWLVTAPEYVAIRRVPALSTEAWGRLAKLFYSSTRSARCDRLHWQVYDSFHFEDVRLKRRENHGRLGGTTHRPPEVFGDLWVPGSGGEGRASARVLKGYDVRGCRRSSSRKFLTRRACGGTSRSSSGSTNW